MVYDWIFREVPRAQFLVRRCMFSPSCLGVVCGVRLDFRGGATGAILGSTVDTCSCVSFYLAVTCSLSGCCMRNTENLVLQEIFSWAMLGLTVNTCSASVRVASG